MFTSLHCFLLFIFLFRDLAFKSVDSMNEQDDTNKRTRGEDGNGQDDHERDVRPR